MKTLEKQFKLLQNIAPSEEWKTRQREILFSQIRGQVKEEYSAKEVVMKQMSFSWELFRTFSPRFIFRPMGTIVLALLFIGVGSVASVSAGKSLPGDTFYPVKLMTERAQLVFSPSKETRAHLEVEFAGRRLEELSELAKKGDSTSINKTVERVKTNLKNAQNTLSSLETEKKQERAQVAKNIEGKTVQYEETLSKSMKSLPQDVQEKVAPTVSDTLKEIDASSNAALSTLVETEEEGVSALLENRILHMRTKLGELRAIVDTEESETAIALKESFNEVDELLAGTEGSLNQKENGKALELLSKAGELLVAVQKQVSELPISNN